MLQFYFLSILLNIVAGLVFIYAGKGNGDETSLVLSDSDDFNPETDDLNFDAEASSSEKKSSKKENLKNALTGLMKLLSPIQYDVAVVGDLIPALAGLAAGAVLLLDWYQERSEVELPLPEMIQNIYTGGRKYLGIFCIIAAVLHFIFPLVLFL